MADNDWKSRLGMVYSTDPGFNYETDDEPEAETLPAGQQDLRCVARPANMHAVLVENAGRLSGCLPRSKSQYRNGDE